MKIRNMNNISFGQVLIEDDAFDRASKLARYKETSNIFNNTKDELIKAAEKKQVIIAPRDDFGVCTYQINSEGKKSIIVKDSDFIQGLKKTISILTQKGQAQRTRKKPFQGTNA